MNLKSFSFKYRFSLVFCGLLLGAGVGPAEVQGYQLPDTGQTKCYDNYGNVINCPALGMPFYGQDAQYKGAQPAYQNNIAGTVADLNTKLVWQQDGGNYGTWQYARAICTQLNIQAFGGYTDWRLPGRRELISIVNYGRIDPAININFFPASAPSSYWSSTPFVPLNTYYVWVVDFASGIAYPAEGNVFSTIQHYVRCVRGSRLPEGAGYGQFVANFDGTITDIATGLIWESQRVSTLHFGANATGSWQKALSDCERLTVAGKVDWRLPNIRELENLRC